MVADPTTLRTASGTPDASRRLPVGAEVIDGGVHFRVWAPRRQRVEVVFDLDTMQAVALEPEEGGYFRGASTAARAGARYRLRLDGDGPFPDPASRYQPEGPHGPSQVVDPSRFEWTDRAWKGIGPRGQVLYELHLGTFTPEGTCAAAARELPALRDLGITCIELMPIAEFAGRWGWGYDGVALFAPYHNYGAPDDFRLLIDRAHELGMGVILDLVYNHLGPDGNYLRAFSEEYFSREHMTDWGEAMNFDGHNAGPVREFFVANAVYWVREFHLDGFRFDATQAIVDGSTEHILAAISREARRAAAQAGRALYITNENEPQQTEMVRPAEHGGIGFDSLWNDDFHHSAAVALIGRNEAFYTDYEGSAQELLSAAKWGYLYQGQRYKWQQQRRGTPALDLPPSAFVHFLQNHDQIANFGRGHRLDRMTSPALLRAMTAFWLLMPQTPMFFQGQEYAASGPFHYFADHNRELSDLIRQGRIKELSQFPAVAADEMRTYLVDPAAEDTFADCRLDHAERQRPFHREMFALHRDLLRLRREDLVLSRTGQRSEFDGSVLGRDALVLRFFGETDRLLLLNLGRDLRLNPAPEPLLAPPRGMRWQVLWSSEDPRYGGYGTAPPDTEREGWMLQGRMAMVLKPAPEAEAKVETRYRVQGSAQAARRRMEGS